MKYNLSFLILLFLLFSCNSSDKTSDAALSQQELEKRELDLSKREIALKTKEHQLAMRELHLDSILNQIDTVGIYNPKILGNWNVNMRCTETGCAGSAIGDTQTEQWNISYQNNIVVARTMNNKMSRTYTGLYNGNKLILKIQKEQSNQADITIILALTQENRLEGRREVTQEDGCKIIYALEVEKL